MSEVSLSCKEILMIDEIIMKSSKKISTAWIDIKKAFDSISRTELRRVIEETGLSKKIREFILKMYENPKTELQIFDEEEMKSLGTVHIEKGILQGDSLSPSIFILAIQKLVNQIMNEEGVKVKVKGYDINVSCLLFMDDIKLYAKPPEDLQALLAKVKKIIKELGMKTNEKKSANMKDEESELKEGLEVGKGMPLGQDGLYKYLGFKQGKLIEQEVEKPRIRKEFIRRCKLLAKCPLTSRNLRIGVNEIGFSLLNYTAGIIDWSFKELEEFKEILIVILKENGMFVRNSNKLRIFRKNIEGGLGFTDASKGVETMVCKMFKKISTRCTEKFKMIYDNMGEVETVLSKSTERIKERCKGITLSQEKEEQVDNLEVKEELLLKIWYEKREEEYESLRKSHAKFSREELNAAWVDKKASNEWLRVGTNSGKVTARLMNIQDRNIPTVNILRSKGKKCYGCNLVPLGIDHLASKCGKLIYRSYKDRHDSLVKMIQYNLCKSFGVKVDSNIEYHKLEGMVENSKFKIHHEMPVGEQRNKANRPDLILINKERKIIQLIEVGVSAPNLVRSREIEKRMKYVKLSEELEKSLGMKCEIVPVVVGWNGIVTNYFKYNLKKIGLEKQIGYMQRLVLKMTYRIILGSGAEVSDNE